VNIQFDSHDPALAARVANSLARLHRDKTCKPAGLPRKGGGLAFAATVGVKARLEKSEEHLQDYARPQRFGLSRIGQGTKPQRRERAVQQLQEELTKAEAQRYEKEALYRVGRVR